MLGRGEANRDAERPRADTVAAVELRDALDLLDWKRRVFALYGEVRAEPDPQAAWQRWRDDARRPARAPSADRR